MLTKTQETGMSLVYGDYEINLTSILSDLDNRTDPALIFIPIETETAEMPPAISGNFGPVEWSQSDFLTIANALHQFHWGESTDGWEFHSILAGVSCAQVEFGNQMMSFQLFRLYDEGNTQIRVVHTISVIPLQNKIHWSSLIRSPADEVWGILNIDEIVISANDALAIAEANGGQENRQALNNNCDISTVIGPELSYRAWRVSIYPGNFIMDVDIRAGKPERKR